MSTHARINVFIDPVDTDTDFRLTHSDDDDIEFVSDDDIDDTSDPFVILAAREERLGLPAFAFDRATK